MATATKAPLTGYRALSRRQLIGTIGALQLALLLAALDQTVVGTAMPRIIAQLSGFDRYAWVTTAYLLTSTAAVLIFGKLSDLYGRKRFYLFGTALFVVASALCGAAGELPLPLDGMNQLVLFRGLQGLAGGIVTGITFIIVGDLFPPAERGKYQGLFSAVFGLASVFGPALGGWITEHASWRWVFYVNLPVGLLAFAVLYLALPNLRPASRRQRAIDWAGVVTLVGGLVPLLLALTWVTDDGWTSGRVLGCLALAAVMLGAFLLAETRAAEPIVPLSLFRSRTVAISLASLFITGVGMFGAIMYIPLFMQDVIGVSAAQSGTLLTPMMLTMIFTSVISGQIVSRTGRYKPVALGGLTLMALGAYLLAGMGADTTWEIAVRNMLIVGLGLGALMPVYTVVVQNAAPPRLIGAATSATQFFRSVGGTVGTAVFGTVMLSRFHARFAAGVPSGTPPSLLQVFENPLQLAQVLPGLQAQLATTPGGPQLLQALLEDTRGALVYALDGIFLLSAALLLATLVLNVFLPEVPLRGRAAAAAGAPEEASPEGALATGVAAIEERRPQPSQNAERRSA